MAELILCELGEQGVLVLLAHGQAGASSISKQSLSNRSTLSMFRMTPRLQTMKFSCARSSCSTWEKVETARHSPSSLTMRT